MENILKISFFYTGRILNRFSKDTGAADELLPLSMLEALQVFSVGTGILVQVLLVNWWSIFPMLVMGFLFIQFRNIYLASAQDIKRLEGNGESRFCNCLHVFIMDGLKHMFTRDFSVSYFRRSFA